MIARALHFLLVYVGLIARISVTTAIRIAPLVALCFLVVAAVTASLETAAFIVLVLLVSLIVAVGYTVTVILLTDDLD
jgi:hypothetical protein